MPSEPPPRPDLGPAIERARRTEFIERSGMLPTPPGPPRPGGATRDRLRLCYLVPRTDLGGGARMLFEHANRLTGRGHEVTVLSHFPPPSWFDLRAPYRQVPFGVELAEAVPACDVIVAGYWDQIPAARALGVAPVVHFEQGDFHLFEDVDEQMRTFVTRSLLSADATITVSGMAAGVLRDRFGVDATVVHNAADAIFTPDGPADPPTGRPYVLCMGYDGNEYRGLAEMRQVWRELSREGRALDLVWVTPRPPLEPFGHVVVAPDRATLAALYRGASVFVCPSRYETFALPCLEAMASGTPVVSTRNVGVGEYARDGENALLADVRDVDGLAAQVLRVLDEPDLPARLRAGGLATAADFSWDAVTDRLEDTYRAVGAAWSPPEDADGWRFELSGLRFIDPDAEERLRRRAAVTTAARIAVPVTFPALEGHGVVRWQVVGQRRGGGQGTARVYLPAHADRPPRDLPYAAALRQFNAGRYDGALTRFVDAYRRAADPASRASLGRWIVLTLLQLGRDAEAVEVAVGGLQMFPDHSDYHYLCAVTGLLTGVRVDGAAYVTALETLGPATRYDEWFDEPDALARERLLATVS